MKIVHFRSTFDIGLGYDTLSMPLEQLKLGHDVCVVTTDRASSSNVRAGTLSTKDQTRLQEPWFEVRGLDVYRLPSSSLHYDDVVIPKGVRALLRQLRPDVVQTMAAKEIIPCIAARYKALFGYTLFTREDQYDFPASSALKRAIIKAEYLAWRRFWCEYAYNRCDCITESSMAGMSFLKRYHHIKQGIPIKYMPVCVDQSHFHPDAKARTRMRKQLGLAKEDKVVISTGKIVPLKNFELFIDALSVLPKGCGVQAWVIGGGDPAYISALKRRAVGKGCGGMVRFMPNVPHEKLPSYYNAADIGFWNRSTSSIQEAMSCGLPVIVPRYVSTVLPEYGSGEIVADHDAQGLGRAIVGLAHDSRHAKTVAGQCLKTAKQRLDIAAQAKELIEMYEESLRRRQSF